MQAQQRLIARVRSLCQRDPRIIAALMYGSFTRGEGDQFSDIEFFLFFDDQALDTLDPIAWLNEVEPVELYFVNEFGVGTAIFRSLVRGEFHFEPIARMNEISGWPRRERLPPADKMVIIDRTRALTDLITQLGATDTGLTTADHLSFLWGSYLNWMLFGVNVLARGEHARALEILGFVQRYLLWFARIREASYDHWLTPARKAEKELSADAYARFVTCTASLEKRQLERAYANAWTWGQSQGRIISLEYGLDLHERLVNRLDGRFSQFLQFPRSG